MIARRGPTASRGSGSTILGTRRLWLLGVLGAGAIAAVRGRRRRGGLRSLFARLLQVAAYAADRSIGWHRLPWPLGLPLLVQLRHRLRSANLHHPTAPALPQPPPTATGTLHLTARTADGTFNDLANPAMGSVGTRFGRNVPLAATYPEPDPEILSPNPRTVSRELLTRDAFRPAESLNLLAAAWIQFMVRDWFSHGRNATANPWVLPLADDDPWPRSARPMTILRTAPDPTRPAHADGAPPTYVNTETHWWDASQIYGSTATYQQQVRSGDGGKLRIGDDGLPDDRSPLARAPGGRPRVLAGPGARAVALHARAQRDLRPAPRRVPRLVGRRALPPRPARQRGAHRQDPHGRVDARDHRPPDDPPRHARQLVGPGRRAGGPAGRAPQRPRGRQRHPGVADRPLRRALRDDRGVRRRLPDAPADPGRVRLPRRRRPPRAPGTRFPGRRPAGCPGGAGAGAPDRPVLLVRGRPPRRPHPAQLPPGSAGVRASGRAPARPGGDGHPPHPGAGGAPLQRLPQAAPPAAGRVVRRADRQPGVGGGTAPGLRRASTGST